MNWERFFNWQSDMDWTWGPFLKLRPSPDTPLRPWVWMRLFLVLSLAGLLLITLGALVCILGPRLAAREHWTTPAPLAETLATLTAMAADPGFQAGLIGLGLSLPLLFAAACWPFHAAWNRRAARLSSLRKPEAPDAPAGVWPPAPRRHQ